jgi:hypothetical protein
MALWSVGCPHHFSRVERGIRTPLTLLHPGDLLADRETMAGPVQPARFLRLQKQKEQN